MSRKEIAKKGKRKSKKKRWKEKMFPVTALVIAWEASYRPNTSKRPQKKQTFDK